MSQQGKQFLSGLVNRVFHSKKKTNAPSRRLGMEPLEDRQLLAVDPTLLAAANAEAAQTSTLVGPVVEFDLAALNEVKAAAPTFSVSNGIFEETTLVSKPESFQATVGDLVSNATIEDGTAASAAPDIAVSLFPESDEDAVGSTVSAYSNLGWAATLANMLTYTGWGPASQAVNPESSVKPENQVFDYFSDAFTNDQTSLLYGLAWFMNGSAEYNQQGQEGWAQLDPNTTAGNLFPTTTGQWDGYRQYCEETLVASMLTAKSPFYSAQNEYLSNNAAVGVEIRFSTIAGDATDELTQQPIKEWVTLWGFTTDDKDGFYNENDVDYYTGMVVSRANGEICTIPVKWDNAIGSYRLVGLTTLEDDQKLYPEGQVPYVYSFTSLERMPGYGVEDDQFEKNDSEIDVIANPKADLGELDLIVGDATGDRVTPGNDLVLENLTLYSDKQNKDEDNDEVDLYAFSLGQTASNSDYILLEYQDAYGVAPLNVTLCLRGEDNSLITLDPTSYGYEPGRYDATFSKETTYQTGEDGKIYSTTTCRHRISLAGLNPGGYNENQFYLKVEFADKSVKSQVNDGYKLTFHTGFDDSFEQNDGFEDVVNAPVGTGGNLGVLFGDRTLSDLVLKQYARNEVSEVDWFRFEMTGAGDVNNEINLYYQSKFIQDNDGDLDFYLYKEDANDPRGYSIVRDADGRQLKSELRLDGEQPCETISLNGLDAGVYFVKIVGFKNASNVGYKLEFKPGCGAVLDARVEAPSNCVWESPLVVTTQKQAESLSSVFSNETTIGANSDIYLNYGLAISQSKENDAVYAGAKLALYINGKLVDPADVAAALNSPENVSGMLASTREKLVALFTTGLDMNAGQALSVGDFNIGSVSDKESLAGKYFDDGLLANNAIALVLNPANYQLGAFYAPGASEAFAFNEGEEVVLDGVEATFKNGAFVDASGNEIATQLGSTASVDRGDGVFTVTKAFGTALANGSVSLDYVANEGVAKEIEYLVDNNFASGRFTLDNMDEDRFAPNASKEEVVENDNPRATNPDLGVANIERLSPMTGAVDANGDPLLHRFIDDLRITGKTNKDGSPIYDWFKFDLKDDPNAETQNYLNAFVEIKIHDKDETGRPRDLDLVLYKVDPNNPDKVIQIGVSSGVSDVETIKFADINEKNVGKPNYSITEGTYFVCVKGHGSDVASRYSLELGGFVQSGAVVPTDPQEYFNDETTTEGKDAVTILNSVATLNWQIPNGDYVSDVQVRYRAIDADGKPGEWSEPIVCDRAATGCKIAGLSAATKYEFQLQVKNHFTEEQGFEAPEGYVLDNGWLCASVEKTTADFLNEVVYRAVIVGVSDYPGTADDLTAAANDAEAFRDALLADPQWAEENITLLKNADATKNAVLNALEALKAKSDDNDVIVFYFAGGGTAGFVGGEAVGYLKTYGTQRSQYVSSLELTAAFNDIAAGSKLFVLDGGQVAKDVEETAMNYEAFANSLTHSKKNGASARPAQTSVLTAGTDGQISPVGVMQRSEFSLALTAGIAELQKVGPVAEEDAETAAKPEVGAPTDDAQDVEISDGRVTMQELADLLAADERLTKLELFPTYATNDVAEAVLANGEWSENAAFQEKWLAEKAIVVTTTVDAVDAHDGKISLREAAALLGTSVPSSSELVDGAKFTLGAGSVVTIGTTTGALAESIVVEYAAGSFRTTEPCAVNTETKTIEFKKTNVAVVWTAEDWADGLVSLTDDAGVAVADVEFKLYATVGSKIVDDEKFETHYLLQEGATLKTAVEGGETLYVVAEGQGYKLKTAKGEDYLRTTGLYVETTKGVFEEAKLSTRANVEQNVEMTKIVFDESLAGQALTVDDSQGAIVLAKGGIIDATNLKGELAFNASTGALRISGTDLVSLIGVKITGANEEGKTIGSAIIVDEGAKFELANSLISDCKTGSNALVSNAGWLSFVNVTLANCASENAIFANAATGTLELANSLFALNQGTLVADATGAFELAATNVDAGAEDPGFVDAAKGDYRLVSFDSAPVDRGSNAATRLACGLVLDFDLAGAKRIGLGGVSVDAGAFEYEVDAENHETRSTVVTTFEDIVDPTDGEISLREAFNYAGTTYEVETELQEGDVLTTVDGRTLEVKNGVLVEFEGVSGTQSGMFYALQGVYMVDAYGAASALEEAQILLLEDGTEATVFNGKLFRPSGVPVQEGAKITDADGATGTLSYGAIADFHVGQAISVALTATTVQNLLPAGTAFDAKTYVAKYQKDGTFAATVDVTTTDEANKTTTTQVAVTFTLPAGAEFEFMLEETTTTETTDEETGETITTTETTYTLDPEAPLGVIATSRAADMEDGLYALVNPLVEPINGKQELIFEAGTTLKLERGVFYDADGKVVALPARTELISPTGAQVLYLASNYASAGLQEGDVLTLADGSERNYKEGLTVYESITLGTTITFEDGLTAGVVELEKGEITVERAVTLDATTIGGLTLDAGGASRVFNVDMYRETSATASAYFAGLTIQNGAAKDGGLIYVAEKSSLKIADSTLQNATATRGGAVFNAGSFSIDANSKKTLVADVEAEQGGAIYNEGTLSVGLATIDGATANAEGGAIYNVGTASLAGATIENATAGTDGGAVYNAGVFSATRGATISGAKAQNGAAIYNLRTLNLNNATVANSEATGQGAVYNAGTASLTNATLSGNKADAVYNVGDLLATRSVFAGNVGGAVVSTGAATLASSLVLANEGENALAAFGVDSSLFLVNVTAVGNVGGVYASEGALTIYNSIIGGTVAQDGASLDVKYSMVETTVETLDETNVAYAPDFNDFDATKVWTEWNLRLAAGSAAIDGASSEYAFYLDFNGAKVALKVDYSGEERETGNAVDMGAFEIDDKAEAPSTIVTTLEDTFDPYDNLTSLREAVKYAAIATGTDEASRTVTFSPDLFVFDKAGTITLSNGEVINGDGFGGTERQDLGAIVLSGSVIITSAYVDEFGETKYYDITIDGRNETQLFVKTGDGDVEFRGFTFTNGAATGETKNGGAFELREGSLSLVDSVVANNYASRDGGAVYQNGGVFFAVNTVFYGNEAKRYGGAIAADAGKVYVYNSTIALNEAGVYGGVYSEDGLVTIANSIVAKNGGAQNVDVRAQNLEATTNLIGGMDAWRTVAGLNGNVVGTVLAPVDPGFENWTDPESEDFLRLSSTSAAVNSGSNVYAFGPNGVRLKFDLNGDERVVGTVVDMGAYESQYLDVPSTVVTTLADVVNQEDGLISLREALAYAEDGAKITFDLGDATDATLRLDGGAITLDKSIVLDASNIPGGLTIEGDGDRIFNVENGADVTLENVVLTGGEASEGGAIYMKSGKLTAINCVIYGNEATKTGGAIYAIGGDVKLLNTTIAGNEAQNFPGVYFGNANGNFELQNSIIAANASETSAAIENYDLHVTGAFKATASIVGAATEELQKAFDGVNGVLVGSPEAFVDAGFVDEASNNYALRADSPAINKGSNRLIGQAGYYGSILASGSNVRVIATDLNGDERLVGGTVDMGAYEYQTATETPSTVVTTAQDVVDPFDGLISLREAIEYSGSAFSVDGYVQKVGTEITFDAALAGQTIALAETLEITKYVTIDAVGLAGGLTLDAGGEFVVVKIDATPDSLDSKVVLAGLKITGGFADCGAGVYCVDGDVQILNCVIYGNEAQTGAGVRVDGGSVEIVNTTITKNEATSAYGGLYCRGDSVALYNSIVALNTVNGETDGADAFLTVGSPTDGAPIRASLIGAAASWVANAYNGVAGNIVGSPNAPVDPAFTDWANNDFTLGQNADGFASVALNAGDNSLTAYPNRAVPAFDAAGAPRFVGGSVDMGAYESPLGPTEIPSLIVTTAQDVVNPYDGDISLREAVAYANNFGLAGTITFAESINGSTFYLNSELKIGSDLTIDGLANNALGIVLTTSNDVADQRIINVDAGNVVLNGLTITNRRSERLQAGLDDLTIEEGGAIYVRTGSVSIYNSLLTDNAAEKGSAVYVNEENATAYAKLVNCTVVANTTNGAKDTAALYAELGSIQLYNTIVALNESTSTDVAQDVYQGVAFYANDETKPFAFEDGDKFVDGVVKTYREDLFVNAVGNEVRFVEEQKVLIGDVETGQVEATYRLGALVDAEGNAIQLADGAKVTLDDVVVSVRRGQLINAEGNEIQLLDGQTIRVGDVEATYRDGRFVDAEGKNVEFAWGQTVTLDIETTYQKAALVDAQGAAAQVRAGDKVVVGGVEATYQGEKFVDAKGQDVQLSEGQKLVVGGVIATYQDGKIIGSNGNVLSANVGWNAVVARGDYLATLAYRAPENVEAFNSFVSRSESLAAVVSGNGCFIGSSKLDLTAETNALFVDADNQNYRLNDDALATNAGDNKHFQEVSSTFNGTFDSFDLDGERRIYYTTTDMGAFENQAAKDAPFASVAGKSVTLNVSTGLDVVDSTDGKTSLREALELSDRLYILGYDDITIQFLDNYSVKVGETAFQVNSPVDIRGANAIIDCGNANSAFLIAVDGEVVIQNFEIKNGAALDGGAIKLSDGDLTLANVLMNNCEATVFGGALYVANGANATLHNVTIAKNVAVDGAGVYGEIGSNVKIYNSVVASNRSATSGVSPTDVSLQGDFELAYTLVGNAGTAANAAKLRGKATNAQIGYGVDNEIDPGFIAANNGNFRLSLVGSPAVKAGDRDYVYNRYGVDLDNTQYGSFFQPVSMGAYQVGEEAPSTVVTTLKDVVDSTDGLTSLREALQHAGDAVIASGAGSLDGSAYAAVNAMNTAYSATIYSPVTFDPSLAGGTIVLDPEYGTIQLDGGRDRNGAGSGYVYDYVIDASSIAGLGGITIDASNLGGGGGWFGGGTAFQVQGRADTTNGYYWPVHLDLRNVHMVGDGGTGVAANPFGMVTMRSCLVEGFHNAVTVADDDSADGGIAHIYSSTLIGGVSVGGKAYVYNSVIVGELNIQDKETDPGYRAATVYNSYVQRTGGLGRVTSTNVIFGGSTDDLFVDAANGDYRLARYSLGVNRGDATYLRTLEATHAKGEVDLNGNQRVSDGVVDMGCYESQRMVDVPSTVVTTELDVVDSTDGLTSIREAVAYAVQNSTLGKTVTFDASLDGKTIVLDGVLELTREVNFNGGDVDVTLSGGGENAIFSIALNADDPVYGNVNDFTISNLTLTGGNTTKDGGAIEISRGNVLLNGVDIYGCSAGGFGGAIYAYDSELTLTNCRIGGNTAAYYGGVVNQFGSTVLLNCYVAENVGLRKNSDVWGYYPNNYANSKNNVIGFVQDVLIVDGQYGNRVGTEANPLKPFVNVSVGNLEIKPEAGWGGATTPTTPPVSASILDDAFAAFVDEEDAELAVDLAVLGETVFDDDLFASFEQF